MLNQVLSLIKKMIPRRLFKKIQPFYHWLLVNLAALIYWYPSEKMIIVGVTGTAGKSSTSYFVAQVLENAGFKVGMSTTTLFKVGSKEWLNDKKMTMLGRFQLQNLLRNMLRNKCQVAIIETTSQGIEQFRHLGINYDILVFTNLYPEHIEAHGGFEAYKRAKGKLFKYLSQSRQKKQLIINNQQLTIHKTIIVNLDDQHAEYFLSFPVDKKIGFSAGDKQSRGGEINSQVDKVVNWGRFNLKIKLLGDYNVYNILAAMAVAGVLGISQEKISSAVARLKPLPGRLEFIPEAEKLGIKVLVDYAFEPVALEKLYQTIQAVPHRRVIHILGSTGGTYDPATQRDKSRRPVLGKIAATNADIIIVTNEDPYDEDPKKIIADVVSGAMGDNFQFPISDFQTIINFQILNIGKEIFAILDRRKAIAKALELAEKDDLILITGKGAEQVMCLANGKMAPWDDRRVVREEIEKLESL